MKRLLLTFSLLLMSIIVVSQSDDCQNAMVLTDLEDWCSADGVYTNVGATSAHTSSSCWTGADSNADVWFKFTSIGAAVNISVEGQGTGGGTLNRPQIAILAEADLDCAGGAFANDQCAESSNGSGNLYASGLDIGVVYYIRIDGRGNNSGTFKLCVNNFNPPVLPGQDCSSGSSLCNKNTITQPLLSGYGSSKETAGTCMGNSDNNSVWYTFTAADNGTLTFIIDPLIPGDDFDWVLFEIPGGDCNAKNDIRCNASSCDPNAGALTGLATSSSNTNGAQGCSGFTQAAYQAALLCSPVTMTAGMTYGLIINNWTDASVGQNNGFNLSFGGTGTFVGPVADVTMPTGPFCTGTAYSFADNSTGSPTTWEWDFGADATPATYSGQNPSSAVTYSTAGTKTIVLTVDNGDCSDVFVQTIEVVDCVNPCNANPGTISN